MKRLSAVIALSIAAAFAQAATQTTRYVIISENSGKQTGEQVVDPRLDVFRDFVNSLDVDPGAGGEERRGS